MQENRHETEESREPAEGDAIKEAESIRVGLTQEREVFRASACRPSAWWIFREDSEDNHREQERNHGEAKYGMPAERFSEPWAKQCCEKRAGISGSRNAHCETLVLGRIPAAGHRQRNCETGPSYAQ